MKCRCSSGGGGGKAGKKGDKTPGAGEEGKVEGWQVSAAAHRARGAPRRGPSEQGLGTLPLRSAEGAPAPPRRPLRRRAGGGGGSGDQHPGGKAEHRRKNTPPTRPLPVFKPLRVRWKTNKCHRRRYAAAEEGAASGKEERVTRAPKEELRRTVLHRFRARPEHGRWRYPTCRPYVRCKHRHVAEGQAEGKTAPPKFTGQLGEAIAACSKPESRDIKVPD